MSHKVRNIVKDMYNKGYINEHVKRYMMPMNPRVGEVTCNPKVHKKALPMGVIVSSIDQSHLQISRGCRERTSMWSKATPILHSGYNRVPIQNERCNHGESPTNTFIHYGC